MVIGDSDADDIITKFQSKLASSQKLFVLPSCCVGVDTQPWEPLCNFINVIAIVFKQFKAGARSDES